MVKLDWSRWKNFTRRELQCKCGCGRADMDADFMDALQALRTLSGFPFIITSGYRCPDHNAVVSSTGRTGPHTTGRAVDIAVSGERAFRLIMYATGEGFGGIGVRQHGRHDGRFIHIDQVEDEIKRPWIWSYGGPAVPHEGNVS